MSDPAKRVVFTDGLKNPHSFSDYEDGVYCVIGPFKNFNTEQPFQDQIECLAITQNYLNGHITREKFDDLISRYKARAKGVAV